MPARFDMPIITNDLSIDRVLAAGLPLVLVFVDGMGARSLNEPMERLAREYAGSMLLAKIEIKDNPASARRFGISRSPALVTLANGQVRSQAEDITAADLQQHTAYLLGKGSKPDATSPRAAQPQGASASAAQSQPGRPRVVTDQTFDQDVMRSPIPVLVDFWAPWCGPCRMTEPIVEKLAREMGGRLKVAKVNVDENPLLSQRYDIRSIPTMMVVKNGKIQDRWMGALPEPAMRSRILSQI